MSKPSIYDDAYVVCDEIKGIDFDFLTSKEIKDRSVCDVTTYDSFENANGITYFKIGGLADPRQGTTMSGIVCPTCNQNRDTCPGHFGNLELPVHFFHPFFTNDYIVKILKSVCPFCCHLRIPFEEASATWGATVSSKERLQEISKICQDLYSSNNKTTKKCQNCSSRLPKITKMYDKFGWVIPVDDPNLPDITATRAFYILSNIPKEHRELLGFSKNPRDLIWKQFPIPPQHLRPPIISDYGTRTTDDWTTMLYEITKTTMNMKKGMNDISDTTIENYKQRLSFDLWKYGDNGSAGSDGAKWIQRNGQPISGLRQRLETKEGRIRGNLMGKRVDFSSRSVITPDPNIATDQVGVPIRLCKVLTWPEQVSLTNIDYLHKLISNGASNYPGANYIVRRGEDGLQRKYDLSISKKKPEIKVGDIVLRHLLENDILIFNRQPSLHRMSMMGHYVKPLEGNTFRLNPTVCGPYNADFDGGFCCQQEA